MTTNPQATSNESPQGKVYLVGAGPGDPGLLTLRGAELIRNADVVLYDYLVNPITTLYAGEQTELVCLGRHGRTRIWTQDEINRQLVQLSQRGKMVVRLKSGDPMIFARAAEELAHLAHHNVPFEIVPGITAAMALGSYAGIPLTQRDTTAAVAFVTGQERAGKQTSSLDYRALARFPGTIVIYMGVTTVANWSSQLIAHGMSADTPVALIRRCSFPDQACQRTCLGDVTSHLTPYSKFAPPVLVVIGDVAASPAALTWFQKLPLFGQTIMVTRPAQRSIELAQRLSQLGARVIQQPAIRITPTTQTADVDEQLRKLTDFEWLVFSSAHGVTYFFERLEHLGLDVRAIGRCQLAVVGPTTARALRRRGLQADLVPRHFSARALADELLHREPAPRCLVVRGSRSTGVIEQRLTAVAAPWSAAEVYSSTDVEQPGEECIEALDQGSVDWTLVTSPAIARSLAAMLGERLRHTNLVSISLGTSSAIRELGLEISLEAVQATTDSMVQSLVARCASLANEHD